MSALRIGTRGSGLALAQAGWTARAFEASHPGRRAELVVIKTTGDRLQSEGPPDAPLDKGLFTKEIELALLQGEVDAAVHSLKDLPTELDDRLCLAAIPARADARDVLVTRTGGGLAALPPGAVLATGSPRRRRELNRLRPDLQWADIRGNIDTRLRKLAAAPEWAGLILAAAGLERLQPDRQGLVVEQLSWEEMLPAPGQAALALQCRSADAPTRAALASLHDEATALCVAVERAFLRGLGGGCDWPVGTLATVADGAVQFEARWYGEGPETHAMRGMWPADGAADEAFQRAAAWRGASIPS